MQNILIVEDDMDIQELLKEAVAGSHYYADGPGQ